MKQLLTFVFTLTLAIIPVVSFAQIGPSMENGGFYFNNGQTGPTMQNGNFYSNGTGYTSSGNGYNNTNTTNSRFCDNQIKDLSTFANLGICIINRFLIPLLFGVAILMFIWGVVQFIAHADNEEKRTQGRNFMVYGIISLFVMVTIWGLVNVLSNTFGIKTFIPQLQEQKP